MRLVIKRGFLIRTGDYSLVKRASYAVTAKGDDAGRE